MKGDPKVIEYLNEALRHELTAVNQYWLHYRLLENCGFKELAARWQAELIEEMRHADLLIARTLFLEGHPNMQTLGALHIGAQVPDMVANDLQAEIEARNLYADAAQYCQSAKDQVTRDLFEQLMRDEEGHIDFLETQRDLINQIGVARYLSRYLGDIKTE